MPWQQLKLRVAAEQVELLDSWLSALGAQAITLQDAGDEPILEPTPETERIWQQNYLISLFDMQTDVPRIIETLRQHFDPALFVDSELSIVEDEAWERKWLKDFHPMRFGQRLWICPSTHTPPDANAINIMLDPGLAFGTGTHPTTALCLEWLDAHLPQNQCVIDYGCGSGILAIAAIKLGAKTVWAVDNDPQAITATRDNASRNAVILDDQHICLPKDLPALQADILLANIIASPLIELAAQFAKLLKPQGTLVLSGILENQIDDIKQAYQPWFVIENIDIKEGWVRLVGERI